jgi:phage FluMu protein Com
MTADAQDRCPRCGHEWTILASGKGPHAAAWRCASCNRWLAWVSKRAFPDLTKAELTDVLIRLAAGEPR